MAVELIDLLKIAADNGSSDLHLIVGVPPVLRIHGEIVIAAGDPLTNEDAERLIVGGLPDNKKRALEEDLQLCYSMKLPDLGYFRISIYYEQGQVGASVRIGITQIRTLEELGLPPIVAEITRRPSGLVLVTGPTGSGKTTTLNSMIDLINRDRRCKIIMVEDPIEYVHPNKCSIVVQQEVHSDTHSFSSALTHILRQDPDVIAVGEMRDLETIATALTAAETGHLVISTLHTPDAAQTIDRVVDVFPPAQQAQIRTQLAGCLEAVISQQLLPRVDQPGRVLAAEIMLGTIAVRNIIREARTQTLPNAMVTGQSQQMRTMDSCLKDLYQQGIITYDTALTRARMPAEFRAARSGDTGVSANGTA